MAMRDVDTAERSLEYEIPEDELVMRLERLGLVDNQARYLAKYILDANFHPVFYIRGIHSTRDYLSGAPELLEPPHKVQGRNDIVPEKHWDSYIAGVITAFLNDKTDVFADPRLLKNYHTIKGFLIPQKQFGDFKADFDLTVATCLLSGFEDPSEKDFKTLVGSLSDLYPRETERVKSSTVINLIESLSQDLKFWLYDKLKALPADFYQNRIFVDPDYNLQGGNPRYLEEETFRRIEFIASVYKKLESKQVKIFKKPEVNSEGDVSDQVHLIGKGIVEQVNSTNNKRSVNVREITGSVKAMDTLKRNNGDGSDADNSDKTAIAQKRRVGVQRDRIQAKQANGAANRPQGAEIKNPAKVIDLDKAGIDSSLRWIPPADLTSQLTNLQDALGDLKVVRADRTKRKNIIEVIGYIIVELMDRNPERCVICDNEIYKILSSCLNDIAKLRVKTLLASERTVQTETLKRNSITKALMDILKIRI